MIPDELEFTDEWDSERWQAQEKRYEAFFTEREREEISFCCFYLQNHNHGTDGHILRSIVAKLSNLLGQSEPAGGREYEKPFEHGLEQEAK